VTADSHQTRASFTAEETEFLLSRVQFSTLRVWRWPTGWTPTGWTHRLDALVRSGAVTGYAELARLGHISPARLTQIMVLLHLAPSIQEYLLFLSAADAQFVAELELRNIAREARRDRQCKLFWQRLQK